jgi:putative hydroxymethylpyrimidine transport system substrate-binding protein
MIVRLFTLTVLMAAFIMGAAPRGAMAQEKLTLLLDWFINPDHAPLIVAQEGGYFARHGLDVEMLEPADPNDPPKLVAAGKADLAVSYQPQLHIQVAADLPLARIATLVATPLNSLVVLEDGPIREIADLKGKTIGYSVGGFETALLGAMLAQADLTIDDVTLVNVNFSLSPSLISGQVDAVIGAFRNFELNQMDIVGEPGRAFYPEEHGVPAYDELIVVARNDRMDDPRFKAFLRAVEEATTFVINHPEESWQMFIGRDAELDDELNRRAWADTLPRLALRPAALDRGRYQRFGAFMKASGLVDVTPPIDGYARDIEP